MILKLTSIQWLQLAIFFMTNPLHTLSVPASPHGVIETQPDGSHTPMLYINGDHRFNYVSDENRFAVTQDKDGWFVYANQDETTGDLLATDLLVGSVDPNSMNLTKNIKRYNVKNDRGNQHRRRQEENNLKETETKVSTRLRGSSSTNDNHRDNNKQRELQLRSDEISYGNGVNYKKNVVMLLRFKDHADRSLPTQDEIDTLMNHDGIIPDILPTGSVADVYRKNSFGKLILHSDVLDWITISKTESECADGVNGYSDELIHCIREALDLYVEQEGVQFSDWDVNGDGEFDGIIVMHSGYGSEWGFTSCDGQHYNNRIWSHKWTIPTRLHWSSSNGDDAVTFDKYYITSALWGKCGNEISRIGGIAHEYGHFMNLPDLYDVDGSGNGVGNYDLMANMWGWKSDQYYPPIMSCWTKAEIGWLTPIPLDSTGTYALPTAAEYPFCFKISEGFAENEYLLIENRHATSYDLMMPGQGGLAVWHIDENANFNTEGYPDQGNFPDNGKHYKVSLLQADGEYALEKKINQGDYGDLYREGGEILSSGAYPSTQSYQNGYISDTNIHIHDVSASGTLMTFKVTFEETNESNEPTPILTHTEIIQTSSSHQSKTFTISYTDPVSDDETANQENDYNEKESSMSAPIANSVGNSVANKSASMDIVQISQLDNDDILEQTNKADIQTPSTEICEDDPDFYIKRRFYNCGWIGKTNGCIRCNGDKCAKDFCRKTCGTCQ